MYDGEEESELGENSQNNQSLQAEPILLDKETEEDLNSLRLVKANSSGFPSYENVVEGTSKRTYSWVCTISEPIYPQNNGSIYPARKHTTFKRSSLTSEI